MDRTREFLKRWGGPIGIITALLALVLNYSMGDSLAADSSTQASKWPVDWVITVVIFIFIGWYLYAFTNVFPGEDLETRTNGKGVVWERRTAMVCFSYVFTVLFLLFPFWSRALITLHSKQQDRVTPISIVVGCAVPSLEDPMATTKKEDPKSVPKELRCRANTDQWLVNIGGANVKPVEPPVSPPAAPEENRAKTEKKPDEPKAGGKLVDSGVPVHTVKNSEEILGGLVVPLYFIAVALMGGAVSLLRRVPEIQRRSEDDYAGTEKEPKLSSGEVRERLAFQIMQFISAPLIAITAYHAIAPDTKIASVALAFTAGFASETILLMIRGVVDGIKPQAVTTQPAKGTVSGVVVAQATNQPIPNVALSVIGQPTLTTKSDAHGLFVIHGVPLGDLVIDATLNNQNSKTKVTIDAGKTTVCQIALS